mmetsp:Transcript_7999/g.7493  ORF Transcript_7999/g.7493 Transcript_7999/m.7493 type:complete len:470 (-) Transcript_7999:487-1896(-)
MILIIGVVEAEHVGGLGVLLDGVVLFLALLLLSLRHRLSLLCLLIAAQVPVQLLGSVLLVRGLGAFPLPLHLVFLLRLTLLLPLLMLMLMLILVSRFLLFMGSEVIEVDLSNVGSLAGALDGLLGVVQARVFPVHQLHRFLRKQILVVQNLRAVDFLVQGDLGDAEVLLLVLALVPLLTLVLHLGPRIMLWAIFLVIPVIGRESLLVLPFRLHLLIGLHQQGTHDIYRGRDIQLALVHITLEIILEEPTQDQFLAHQLVPFIQLPDLIPQLPLLKALLHAHAVGVSDSPYEDHIIMALEVLEVLEVLGILEGHLGVLPLWLPLDLLDFPLLALQLLLGLLYDAIFLLELPFHGLELHLHGIDLSLLGELFLGLFLIHLLHLQVLQVQVCLLHLQFPHLDLHLQQVLLLRNVQIGQLALQLHLLLLVHLESLLHLFQDLGIALMVLLNDPDLIVFEHCHSLDLLLQGEVS